MIAIKKRGDKWRINIKEEEWEFDTKKDAEATFKTILDLKDKHGSL